MDTGGMMNTTVALTDGSSIRKAVTEVLRGSSPAYIASPYWSKGTVDALGFRGGSLKGKLEVLCDLRSGSCDPVAIRDLLERGAKVFSVDHLHAKVYMGDTGAIVGSANATTKGLWHGPSKDDGNHEAAL